MRRKRPVSSSGSYRRLDAKARAEGAISQEVCAFAPASIGWPRRGFRRRPSRSARLWRIWRCRCAGGDPAAGRRSGSASAMERLLRHLVTAHVDSGPSRRRRKTTFAGQCQPVARFHSSGSPALRSASNRGCRWGWMPCSVNHLTLSLGLRRRASAIAVFASSMSPLSACPAAKLR
jgi:hypothetical protein